jgi:uncharacterized OsmC-like protein
VDTVRTSTGRVDLGFDQQQLEGLIDLVRTEPDKGKTVWKAVTIWRGGFRSEASIRDFTITMDEPSPLGGSNTAPNMVEVVLGAYGCCLTTGYVMNAGLRGIKLEGVSIELEGDLDLNGFFDLSPETWPGYTTIRTKVQLTAPEATERQLRELHEVVTRNSPVGSILSRPVKIETALLTDVTCG